MFLSIKPRTKPSPEEMIEALVISKSQGERIRLMTSVSDVFWRWVCLSHVKGLQPGLEEYESELVRIWMSGHKLTLILGPHSHGKDALADALYPSRGAARGVSTSRLIIEFVVHFGILQQSPNDPWYGLSVEEIYPRRHERSQWLNQMGRALRVACPGFLLNELVCIKSRVAVGIRDLSEPRSAFAMADQIIWVHNPSKPDHDPTLEFSLERLIGEARQWSAPVLVYYNDGTLKDMEADVKKAIADGMVLSSDPAYASIQPTSSPDSAI